MKCLLSALSLALLFSSAQAAQLTTYLTEWSGYTDNSGYPAYPFDGAYPNTYASTSVTANPDMVNKVQNSDVVEFAFLQVWSQDLINQYSTLGAKQAWLGVLHFDDLWADLANNQVSDFPVWQSLCGSVDAKIVGTLASGTCAAVQLNGNTGQLQVFDYATADQWSIPGQMDNFGAFLKLKTAANSRKVIAIGGANTVTNKSVSTQTFQTIFANQSTFLSSLSAFMTGMQAHGMTASSGVDYDFEPPIDAAGSQEAPSAATCQDYQNLYNLVVATRAALGPDAYIAVTITVNEQYLDYINASVDGGWFKKIQASVNAINLMTYDLHGPWSLTADPGAISHIMLKQPMDLTHTYAINYATDEVTTKILAYGVDPAKLQVGLASYGRGFAGVNAGSSATNPGFDQAWTGAAILPAQYSNQSGMLPYKFVSNLVSSGYSHYDVKASDNTVIASYLYNPALRQFIGYMSPELVDSTCAYIKATKLQGAILWSADTDASFDGSQGVSLISEYNKTCRTA